VGQKVLVRAFGYRPWGFVSRSFSICTVLGRDNHLQAAPVRCNPLQPTFQSSDPPNGVVMSVKINVVTLLTHPNTGISNSQGTGRVLRLHGCAPKGVGG